MFRSPPRLNFRKIVIHVAHAPAHTPRTPTCTHIEQLLFTVFSLQNPTEIAESDYLNEFRPPWALFDERKPKLNRNLSQLDFPNNYRDSETFDRPDLDYYPVNVSAMNPIDNFVSTTNPIGYFRNAELKENLNSCCKLLVR